jgi:hypothetical protein
MDPASGGTPPEYVGPAQSAPRSSAYQRFDPKTKVSGAVFAPTLTKVRRSPWFNTTRLFTNRPLREGTNRAPVVSCKILATHVRGSITVF